jgi:hypothetical protein
MLYGLLAQSVQMPNRLYHFFLLHKRIGKMNERVLLLKIRLLEIEPEIWRRFVVPAGISLDRVHDVIQIVMGWTDSHLHEFTIGKKRYTEYPESKEDGLECGRYRLGDLIKQKGRTFGFSATAGSMRSFWWTAAISTPNFGLQLNAWTAQELAHLKMSAASRDIMSSVKH